MQHSLRIPEIAQRDRFIRRVVANRKMFVVWDCGRLASVPSQRDGGAATVFIWSTRPAAEKWAPVLSRAPLVDELPLDVAMAQVLPQMASTGTLVGCDWCSEPIEPEIHAADLVKRLHIELVENFLHTVASRGEVFLLEDDRGPVIVESSEEPSRLVLPCWSTRDAAEARSAGAGRELAAMAVPVINFLGLTLPWLLQHNYRVAPDFLPGTRAIELSPGDLNLRFRDRSKAA